jgi:class 3 adenylate cyclase
LDLAGSELGGGIGIHTGELSFGEFGRSHRDLTAIGTVVNTASRAQSAAGAAQILVTREVWHRAQPDLARSEVMAYQLKGFEEPIELYGAWALCRWSVSRAGDRALALLFSLQAPAVIGGVFGPVAQPDGATVS